MIKIRHIILPILLLTSGYTMAATQVGVIKYSRGAITVQQEDGSGARLAGKGGAINKGEVLKTGPKSFAIISLDDETKMTIRPRSSFAVEEYTAQKNSKANALLRLFRGGLRTVTGYISKFNPDGYKVRTSVATIGIRGTEFDARLCTDDCAEENRKIEEKNQREGNAAVAKIVFKRGDVTAENFRDETRDLATRDAIFEGDTIRTGQGAYAVMVFRDRSRVSLQELTDFRVDELRYSSKKVLKGASALFSLLRGGLRTVTGLIGRDNPNSYRMRTAVATMGIRGTGYDVICTGPCAFDGSTSSTPLPEGDGMYSHFWEGSGNMGKLPLETNESGFQQTPGAVAFKLPEVPKVFINNPIPKPNTIEVEEGELFAAAGSEPVPPGLYVSVTDGKVTLESGLEPPVEVLPNQAAYAGLAGELTKLPKVPAFQAQDIFPKPDNFAPKAVSLGGSNDIGSDSQSATCEVK